MGVEARDSVNDMTTINSKAASDKRRMESAVHTLHAEIDDMLSQAKSSEEKAKRAMVDAARLADELRAEQDHTTNQAKAKRALESQITEIELRLSEANEVAAKGGRSAMAKLENRIRELRSNLDPFKLRLETLSRHSKRLSVMSRNFNSNRMKTRRTKIGCLN